MFDKLINNTLIKSLHKALGNDSRLHLVGGSVRDTIRNLEVNDFDFCCGLRSEEIQNRLDLAAIPNFQLGFLTTALINDLPMQITPFDCRGDTDKLELKIEDDLKYRDFTINAMAIDLNTSTFVDPYNGLQDIQNKVLRCPSDPKLIFLSDPVRILRLIRFSFTQGFTVEQSTLCAAKDRAHTLIIASQERIRDEFVKILMSVTQETTVQTFDAIHELGLWEYICPEFEETIGVTQNAHHLFTVDHHIAHVVSKVPKTKLLRLAAFFHDIAKPRTISEDENGRHFLRHEDVGAEMVREIGERLKLSDSEINDIALLVKEHMRPINCGPKGARRLIYTMGDLLSPWMSLKFADKTSGKGNASSFIMDWMNFVNIVKHEKNRQDVPNFNNLAIDGTDIMALGVKQGPKVGEILRRLQEIVLDEPSSNTIEILTDFARGMI